MMAFPKPTRLEAPEYLKWIRQQQCVVSKCYWKAEANHIVFNGQGRLSSKVQDTQALPFCEHHHKQYHQQGRAYFETDYGLNLYQLIIDHLTAFLFRQRE